MLPRRSHRSQPGETHGHPKLIVPGFTFSFGALGFSCLLWRRATKPHHNRCYCMWLYMMKNRLISIAIYMEMTHNSQMKWLKKWKKRCLRTCTMKGGRIHEWSYRISILFNHSGGKLTPAMNAAIMKSKIKDPSIDAICTLWTQHYNDF